MSSGKGRSQRLWPVVVVVMLAGTAAIVYMQAARDLYHSFICRLSYKLTKFITAIGLRPIPIVVQPFVTYRKVLFVRTCLFLGDFLIFVLYLMIFVQNLQNLVQNYSKCDTLIANIWQMLVLHDGHTCQLGHNTIVGHITHIHNTGHAGLITSQVYLTNGHY